MRLQQLTIAQQDTPAIISTIGGMKLADMLQVEIWDDQHLRLILSILSDEFPHTTFCAETFTSNDKYWAYITINPKTQTA